jgi:hypothetical protein
VIARVLDVIRERRSAQVHPDAACLLLDAQEVPARRIGPAVAALLDLALMEEVPAPVLVTSHGDEGALGAQIHPSKLQESGAHLRIWARRSEDLRWLGSEGFRPILAQGVLSAHETREAILLEESGAYPNAQMIPDLARVRVQSRIWDVAMEEGSKAPRSAGELTAEHLVAYLSERPETRILASHIQAVFGGEHGIALPIRGTALLDTRGTSDLRLGMLLTQVFTRAVRSRGSTTTLILPGGVDRWGPFAADVLETLLRQGRKHGLNVVLLGEAEPPARYATLIGQRWSVHSDGTCTAVDGVDTTDVPLSDTRLPSHLIAWAPEESL